MALIQGITVIQIANFGINSQTPILMFQVNKRELIHQVLKFTALLIEHSYARHLYNSIEVSETSILLLKILN